MKIPLSDLGRTVLLGKGGLGEVYRIDSYTLPGDPTPLVYKKFVVTPDVQARAAINAVRFREQLDPADRALLDRFSAWPRALVTERSTICGLVMPLIPPEFYCQRMGDSGGMEAAPRELQWLIAEPSLISQVKLTDRPVDLTERLYLLAQLVYVIGLLHRLGLVYGDLSFLNVMYSLDPLRVMLIDCDGAAALTDNKRHQLSSPFWDPPECPSKGLRQQEMQDQVTDVYKLGLAIARCLVPRPRVTTDRRAAPIKAVVDAEGFDLVSRALDKNRSRRPTAKELYGYFERTLATKLSPPQLLARLSHRHRLRGQDVRVEWKVVNATEFVVTAGPYTVTVDPATNPDGLTFRADHAGQVIVTATNKFGATTVDLGFLDPYELPPFDTKVSGLPVLQLPQLPTLAVGSMVTAAVGRPIVPLGAAQPPRLDLPGIKFWSEPNPLARVPSGPDLSDVVARTSADIRAVITAETDAFVAKFRRQLRQRT